MNACELNSTLNRYFDDELPPAQRASFERHLRDCAPCASELEQLRGLSCQVRSMALPKASADFLTRLDALSDRVQDVTVIRFATRLTAAAAAILVAATCHWALVSRDSAASADASSTALTRTETAMVDPESAVAYDTASASAVSDVQLDPIMQNLSGGRP